MFSKQKNEESITYRIFSFPIVKKVKSPYWDKYYVGNLRVWTKKRYNKTLEKIFDYVLLDLDKKLDRIESLVGSVQTEKQNQVMSTEDGYRKLGDSILNIELSIANLQLRVDTINAVAHIHDETFSKYKGAFIGQDIVIIGTGPTLKNYQIIKDAIHIGVNKAYKYDPVNLDFIFIQDIHGLLDDINEINNYRKEGCIKFYGYVLKHNCSIPDVELNRAKAFRYYSGGQISRFYPDIASTFMPEYGSVIFPALAFALYTQPKRIYLVGCDASADGYFDNNKQAVFSKYLDMHMHGWSEFKEFACQFYPNVEIVSINPVGLKGMFKDIYQADRIESLIS